MKNSSNSTKRATTKKSNPDKQTAESWNAIHKQVADPPTVKSLTLDKNKATTAQGHQKSTKPKGQVLFEQAFAELSPERQDAIQKQVGEIVKPYEKSQEDSKGIVHHPTVKIVIWVAGIGAVLLAGWGAMKIFHQVTKQYKGIRSTIAA